MPFKIYSSNDLPLSEWSSITGGSIFSSPEFAGVWRAANREEAFFLEEEDSVIKAGIVGVVFGKRILRRYQSMPDGLQGGPYFIGDYSYDQKDRFMQYFFRWLKSKGIIRADIHNPSIELDTESFRKREAMTHVITFNGESYNPPCSKIREHIRAGKRREGQIEILDDEKYLDKFYNLVLITEKRHGRKPRYSIGFFHRLLRIALKDSRILWLMVLSEDKMIGSRICFIEGPQMLTWQYYSDKKFTHLKPGYLLLDYIIDYAFENDIKTLNLGASPADADALIDFKERWGGERHNLPYYTYLSHIGKLVYGWR